MVRWQKNGRAVVDFVFYFGVGRVGISSMLLLSYSRKAQSKAQCVGDVPRVTSVYDDFQNSAKIEISSVVDIEKLYSIKDIEHRKSRFEGNV